MNLPNALTLGRLVLVAVMMALLSVSLPFARSLALVVFVLAGITDYLDGYFARNGHGITPFGQFMDPLADKILVCAAFCSFTELRLVPAWITVIIIAREFLVTGLRLLAANRGTVIPAGKWGKHKTVWQIVAIGALLLGTAIRQDLLRGAGETALANYDFAFGYIALGVSVAVAAITLASGWLYFRQHSDVIIAHG